MLNFIQNQILGMKWLSDLIWQILITLGFDKNANFTHFLQFFIYDSIKIILLLLGLIFAISYIQSYFSPEKTRKILTRFSGIKANIISALLGTITPFCSCSSIPLFMAFSSAGLRFGVTFSFLISSPMVDLASLVLLGSIFGFKIAFLYVILGLIIAVLGGALIEKFGRESDVEEFVRNANFGISNEAEISQKDRLKFARNNAISTFSKVAIYILIGVLIGAFIHNYIPQNAILWALGSDSYFSVIIATLIGVPIYADIFSVIPIGESLLSKGANLGTIIAFMMAVTTLSLPSLIMLKKAIKTPLLCLFIGITTFGIIVVGYVFNLLNL